MTFNTLSLFYHVRKKQVKYILGNDNGLVINCMDSETDGSGFKFCCAISIAVEILGSLFNFSELI